MDVSGIYSSGFVRQVAASVYGKGISQQSWINWKVWVRARHNYEESWTRTRWFSEDATVTILAIAYLRRGNRFKELTKAQIVQQEQEVRQEIRKLLDGHMSGSEVHQKLQKIGMNITFEALAKQRLMQKVSAMDGRTGLFKTGFYKWEDVKKAMCL